LSRFLRRAGFEVLEVGSVVAALDELMAAAHNDKPFEHAVVDLVLKDGDGEDVVRACESLSPRPNIIVLSGNIDSRRALDLSGRCLYLPKPVGSPPTASASTSSSRIPRPSPNRARKWRRHCAATASSRGSPPA